MQITPGHGHPHCRRAEDRFLLQFERNAWKDRLEGVPLVLYFREITSLKVHRVIVTVDLILKTVGVENAMVASGPFQGMLCTPPVPKCSNAIGFRPFDPKNIGYLRRSKTPGDKPALDELDEMYRRSGAHKFQRFPYIDYWHVSPMTAAPSDGAVISLSERTHHFSLIASPAESEETFLFEQANLFWLKVPQSETGNRLGEDLSEAELNGVSLFYRMRRETPEEREEEGKRWVFRPGDFTVSGTIERAVRSF